ncbi:hypothetical protein C5167_027722 [Papaver somniferum]|nr:hypothetical protein C5167_027722 [Papaver somniferum]
MSFSSVTADRIRSNSFSPKLQTILCITVPLFLQLHNCNNTITAQPLQSLLRLQTPAQAHNCNISVPHFQHHCISYSMPIPNLQYQFHLHQLLHTSTIPTAHSLFSLHVITQLQLHCLQFHKLELPFVTAHTCTSYSPVAPAKPTAQIQQHHFFASSTQQNPFHCLSPPESRLDGNNNHISASPCVQEPELVLKHKFISSFFWQQLIANPAATITSSKSSHLLRAQITAPEPSPSTTAFITASGSHSFKPFIQLKSTSSCLSIAAATPGVARTTLLQGLNHVRFNNCSTQTLVLLSSVRQQTVNSSSSSQQNPNL